MDPIIFGTPLGKSFRFLNQSIRLTLPGGLTLKENRFSGVICGWDSLI